MSDTDDAELEEIRREKLAELRARAEGAEGGTESGGTESATEFGAPGRATESGGAAGPDDDDAPDEPIHLEDPEAYGEHVAAHDVVLVDFYADWCGPCQVLEPVVATLAAETDAAVLKVDIDAYPALANGMNVRGVPTLILYADGDPVERLVGAQGESRLRTLIERHA